MEPTILRPADMRQMLSESEWRALLRDAGLEAKKVWHPEGDGDGIIEAEVPSI